MPIAETWDLAPLFPSFDSPAVAEFEATLARDVDALAADARELADLSEVSEPEWVPLLVRYEHVLARLSHLSTYVGCLASAHGSDARFSLAEARLSGLRAAVEKVTSEFRRGVHAASDATKKSLTSRKELEGAAWFIEKLALEAKTTMRSDLEALASDLGVDGLDGWSRLYDVVSSKLSFEMVWPDGKRATVPMAQRRSLMADADREVRRVAFENGNVAWASIADVTAAALNHIGGIRHTLNDRRGIRHFLDVAVRQAGISQKTLDAMLEAVSAGAPLARRALLVKARAMGLPAISWFDLEAPLPLQVASRIPLEAGVDKIRKAFGHRYDKLARHFDALLETRRIETEARPDKRPGAFCAPSDLTGDAFVFMTYQGSLGDLSTLAHEVGHAFHAEMMRGVRPLALHTPMTLAETASTFAEALLSDGLLADPAISDAERALLLGEIAGDAAAFLLDIPARFTFEKRFYEERRAGEIPTARLSELMAAAERDVFGEALVEGGEDPLFWASKLHFYISDITFYNFPYTFGFLLSRGMVALFAEEGPAFLPKYEAFLRSTGSGPAHEIAKTCIGRDLESPEFWAGAIETLRAPIDELERLLPKVIPR
jgi:oligoendopeptidase F